MPAAWDMHNNFCKAMPEVSLQAWVPPGLTKRYVLHSKQAGHVQSCIYYFFNVMLDVLYKANIVFNCTKLSKMCSNSVWRCHR